MEDSLDNIVSTTSQVGLSDSSRRSIIAGAKWGRFLAIVGFVMTGLMVIAALFMIGAGASARMFGPSLGMMGFLYIIMAAIYFFPCLFLFRYASNVSNGMKNGSEQDIDAGFKNLEFMFKFVGIATIIVLGFYVLMLLFAVVAGAAGGF